MIINKILSVFGLLVAGIYGLLGVITLAASGFAGGPSLVTFLVFGIFTLVSIFLVICSIFVWKNKLWAKISIALLSLGFLIFYLILMVGDSRGSLTDYLAVIFLFCSFVLAIVSIIRK